MQNAALAALRLNWRYLAAEVRPADLRTAIAGARAMGFMGLNLTVPHKTAALEMMDALADKARLLGAVNTIVFETPGPKGDWIPLGRADGGTIIEVRSHGYNTDADGLARSLKEDFHWPDLRGSKSSRRLDATLDAASPGASVASGLRPDSIGGHRPQLQSAIRN